MTSLERVARRTASAEPPALVALVVDTTTVMWAELLKVRHDPWELVTRAIQPILWLLVFGQVLARARAIPTGSLPYLDYLAPGILAQSALFSAILYGIAVIWERDLGVVHKLLVSPASRVSLVLGKSLAGGLRALTQAATVFIVSLLIGIDVRIDPLSILGVAAVVVLGASLFSAFSMIIACIVRSRERFMGIGQVMTMPLFFASSAIYPIALMPEWLKAVAIVNPLTYMVDAIRSLMIVGAAATVSIPVDLAVLVVGLVALVVIGARLYPRLAQ